MSPLHSAVVGLLTGLGLIVAIGAQNAFVLRQGLLRQHVGVIVAICALSDAVLILAGVAGVGDGVVPRGDGRCGHRRVAGESAIEAVSRVV